jgi:hypothetical protein
VFDFIRELPSSVQSFFDNVLHYPEWRKAHDTLLDMAIPLLQQDILPPYVILEIFDRLDHFSMLPHGRKIGVILACQKSIRKLKSTN